MLVHCLAVFLIVFEYMVCWLGENGRADQYRMWYGWGLKLL